MAEKIAMKEKMNGWKFEKGRLLETQKPITILNLKKSEEEAWTYFSSMKIDDVYAGISTRPLRKKLRYLSPASSAVLRDRP